MQRLIDPWLDACRIHMHCTAYSILHTVMHGMGAVIGDDMSGVGLSSAVCF